MSSVIEELKKSMDSVFAVRSQLGAVLHKVYLVTRTWSGTQIGDGEMTEEVTEVTPSPGIKDYSHSIRLQAGGNVKQGDLIIHTISKNRYPNESDLDGSSDNPLIEKLYKIGDIYYRAISVVENHLTWNVQVRKLSDQTRRD